MATKLVDIGKNAVEDGVEDFISSFLFRRMQALTKPFLKDFEGDSEFDNAMQGFIQTLSMGLTLYAYTMIMNFFFERGIKITASLWTYIVAGTMKRKLIEKLKASKFKGNKAVKALTLIAGTDRTSDRIAVAGLIQNNVNSFDNHKMHFQNQHQAHENRLDKMSMSASNLKNSTEQSFLTRFTHKTITGTWANTTTDKRLYEKATGIKISESGSSSWSNLCVELNKYNEFSKTVDGEVMNLATLLQMVLARSGLTR
jgi:hypothetical protein